MSYKHLDKEQLAEEIKSTEIRISKLNRELAKMRAALNGDFKYLVTLSGKQNEYLNWAAMTRGSHKAVVLRNALEETMAVDKEWNKVSAS